MIKKYLFILFIFISTVPLFDLLHPGLPVTHDGQDHVARIANFYKNLEEGIIIPRWAGSLNWGYGHPILMFLYPLPSYLGSFFHFFGFSFTDSVKLVFAAAYITSGIAMYLWLKESISENAGFIGGLLYLLAPYRFVDLYVRGAVGEHVAFIFPPLILFFLLRFSKNGIFRNFLGASMGIAGLILSHNAVSLMFLPVIIVYLIYLLLQAKNSKFLLINFLAILILGFGISAYFWMPALFEGKYTLRDIVTSKDYSSRFVGIQDFFKLSWSYGGSLVLSKQIGIVHWLLVISGLIVIFRNNIKSNKENILFIGTLFLFTLSLFIMTSYSKFLWDSISILQKFQFPWRFLSVSVFASAIIGGLVINVLPKKKQLLFCAIITIMLLLANYNYWYAKNYLNKPETFYSSIYNSTTDTGESSPVWSVRFMEKRPLSHIEILEGNALITEVERKTTIHSYLINTSEKTRIRENTLYFPGWNVYIDGKKVPVEFQDPASRGIMTFWLEKGKHTVDVVFSETKLRYVASLITLFSILSISIWGILFHKNIWQLSR